MTRTSTSVLRAVYGHPAILLDETSLLRDALGPLLARAAAADFAVARFRLEAIDLRADELRGLERCRLLVERLKGVTEGDALAASRAEVAARLELLLAFLDSGRVEVRAAGGQSWTPDFSVLHRVRRADGSLVPALGILGAHFFARPYPVMGPALTCFTPDGPASALLADRFEELWESGYDVAFVIADRIRRGLAARRTEAAPSLLTLSDPGGRTIAEWPGVSPLLVREQATTLPQPTSAWPAGAATAGPAVVSPAMAARAALAARFGPADVRAPADRHASAASEPGDSGRVLDLAVFQQDAVVRARQALAWHGGVVLADEVGLGKTFVALALAEAELVAGGRVLVAAPAALRKEWLAPLRRLARAHGTALVRGTDRSAAADDPPGEVGEARAAWVTHGKLSRGGGPPDGFRASLVVVDEAHAFRNPHTRRYRALAETCRGARVVAITATPLNNRLWDLYWQLRLFASDGAFARQGVPGLHQAFEAAAAVGTARPIVPVLRAVVVRRTRPFLRDHYGAISVPALGTLSLPRRAPPRPVRYRLSPAFPGGVRGVAAVLDGLRLAPYRLGAYGVGRTGGETTGELLRMSLLKRLESGAGAFLASVRALAGFLASFDRALAEGRLLRPRERALVEAEQLVLSGVALDPLPAGTDVARLTDDVRSDAAALRALLGAGAEQDDPKVRRLRELLRELDGPCVVFTEFRETARLLARALAGMRCGLVHGGGAWLGDCPIGRRQLIERFAPRANGARAPAPRERVDVLVATDVLAEGLNLQDARYVVSYDLPWNPVRLMQRIGRVDRLGSPHAEVQPFHFVPEEGLEDLLGVMRRIRRKLRMIRQALPGDAAVLDVPDADDALLLRVLAGDGAALDATERGEAAPWEAEEELRRLWQRVRKSGPSVPCESAGILPAGDSPVIAGVAVPGLEREHVLVCLDAAAPTWLVWEVPAADRKEGGGSATSGGAHHDGDGADAGAGPETRPSPREDDPAAAAILAAALAEGAAALAPDPRLVATAEAQARTVLARRQASAAAPVRGAVACASRLLLRTLAAARHHADPGLCARADILLARLARGLTAGEELAVRRALAHPRVGAEAVVAALEAALAGFDAPAPEPLPPPCRLIAAIHARPTAE